MAGEKFIGQRTNRIDRVRTGLGNGVKIELRRKRRPPDPNGEDAVAAALKLFDRVPGMVSKMGINPKTGRYYVIKRV